MAYASNRGGRASAGEGKRWRLGIATHSHALPPAPVTNLVVEGIVLGIGNDVLALDTPDHGLHHGVPGEARRSVGDYHKMCVTRYLTATMMHRGPAGLMKGTECSTCDRGTMQMTREGGVGERGNAQRMGTDVGASAYYSVSDSIHDHHASAG